MAFEITPASTPNPNARKFILDRPVGVTMRNFGSADEAAAHPLAAQLFRLEDVTNVFMTADFITVNKRPDKDWESLEPGILALIRTYFDS
ncbi:MAG: NifU N-terminal domain-containing protein [Caldilineales bacterium]|nr:NifU N-terminal domain-containing protein [Caldilineales bacterium]